MFPFVVRDLEKRIAKQLGGAFRMGKQPLAAGEKGRRNFMLTKVVDDVALISRNLEGLFAKVECEGDKLLAGGQNDATQDFAVSSNGGLDLVKSPPGTER